MDADTPATSDATTVTGWRWWLLVARVSVSSWLVWTVLSLALVVLLAVAVGQQAWVVTSGSMAPTIARGDVVLTVDAGDERLEPPSVVVFTDDRGRTVTHRIVDVDESTGHYVTRGDANPTEDDRALDPADVEGVGRLLVPFVGLPAVWVGAEQWERLTLLVGAVLLAAVGMTPPGRLPPSSLRRRRLTGAAAIFALGSLLGAGGGVAHTSYATFTAATATTGSQLAADTTASCDDGAGGTIVEDGGHCLHLFDEAGTHTFEAAPGVDEVEVLLVAGGGGGAGNTSFSSAGGGAGGAGGLVHEAGMALAAGPQTVDVGAGGAGVDMSATGAGAGGESSAFGLTALGGGGGILGGGGDDVPAGDGGSGGGARQEPAGQALQPTASSGGQGNDGARNSADAGGGGGGGAGSAPADISGDDGGDGGDGLCFNATFGSLLGDGGCVAGGGGGGGDAGGAAGAGGLGGGGDGSSARDGIPPQDGVDGTGGGGGGGSSAHPGADGGDGVVAVRYPLP